MSKNETSSIGDLQKKIFFTLFILAIYRVGVHVPTPGVDGLAVMSFFKSQSSNIFGIFNTFTGGALSQFSVFALGIMPYISSSIIFQLLTSAVPYLEQLKKEGSQGQKKINQYTRYGTILLAVIQGYGISTWLMNMQSPEGKPLVISPMIGFLPFQVVTIFTLIAGTCFIMWLGEQITEKGIGNGSSLIIFTGIAASIPTAASNLYSLIDSGELSIVTGLFVLILMVVVINLVIYVQTSERRVAIQYTQKSNNMQMSAPSSHLPIKINFSGVIPPIFASSLLMFPSTMANFVSLPWLNSLKDSLSQTGAIYNILFVFLIIFFCFFYTEIVFNPKDVSENLKKSGGIIPGVRTGKPTSDFLQKVLDRINVVGAVFLCSLCVLPGLLTSELNIPFYFGGTSLLILVGVALDTSQQIQSYVITQKYNGLMSGAKIKSRRVQF